MNYVIDAVNTAKIRTLASQKGLSPEIIVKQILDEALKNVEIKTTNVLPKAKPIKRRF